MVLDLRWINSEERKNSIHKYFSQNLYLKQSSPSSRSVPISAVKRYALYRTTDKDSEDLPQTTENI